MSRAAAHCRWCSTGEGPVSSISAPKSSTRSAASMLKRGSLRTPKTRSLAASSTSLLKGW